MLKLYSNSKTMDRPLEDERPIGPIAQGGVFGDGDDVYLMAGFPVELPTPGTRRGAPDTDSRDVLSELKEEISRRFQVSRSDIRTDDVNLSGFNAPVVKFVSFPIADELEAQTARNIADFPDRAEQISQEVLNKQLAANVSIWAGDKRSGRRVGNR